jgi:prefoldin subunit 5
MSAEEIHQKMSEYSSFMNTVLRPDLKQAESKMQDVQTEIDEYEELGQRLGGLEKALPSSQLESVVDLGYKTVFCRAVARDPSRNIFVHVGMGFHIEFTISEAIQFVEKRIAYLKKDQLAAKDMKVKAVKTHIESATAILDQLSLELERTSR